MRIFLSRLSPVRFNLFLTSIIVAYVIGIYLIFMTVKMDSVFFLYLIVGTYPISFFIEERGQRKFNRREEEDIRKGRMTFYRSDEDMSKASLISIIGILLVSGLILLLRILSESISNESAAYSLIVFVISIFIYRKHSRE